jgi:glutaredoxin
VTLTLYGKPGCHLCHDARQDVLSLQRDIDLRLVEVDISTDPELFNRYGERIPVVAFEGQDLLEGRINPAALRKALSRVTGS